jgi:glycosyltransferase involved in cell wall biosynthesis
MSKRAGNTGNKDFINIAMLGHKRIPSREGGIEVVVEELGVRMAQKGHKVTCYNRRGHHVSGKIFDSTKQDEYKGIQLKPVLTIRVKGLSAMTSSFFAALKTAFGDYDVVHFHAEGPCAMLWLPHMLGKRTVATIHGLDWKREKWNSSRFGRGYIKLGEKVAVKFADEIIVLSEGVRQYFLDTYGRDTICIPNGVNRPVMRKADKISEFYGLNKDEYLLFLGRIVPEKGLRYLVKAFMNVRTEKKLVIAGGASDSDTFMRELKAMAEGDRRIIFTGFVQGDLLEELYSNVYVYTLPSDLEGMPISLLEAMSYGNCCLISDIAENTEVVKDRALPFKKGDITDLTKKLQLLCDDPELVSSYKDGASSYICSMFDWDLIAEQTLQLYKGENAMELENGTI